MSIFGNAGIEKALRGTVLIHLLRSAGICYASARGLLSSYSSLGIGSEEIQRSRSAFAQILLQVSVIFMQSQIYTTAFPSLEYVTAPV